MHKLSRQIDLEFKSAVTQRESAFEREALYSRVKSVAVELAKKFQLQDPWIVHQGECQFPVACVSVTVTKYLSIWVYGAGFHNVRAQVRRTEPFCALEFSANNHELIWAAVKTLHCTREAHQKLLQDYLGVKTAVRVLPEDVQETLAVVDGRLHVKMSSRLRGSCQRVL